MAVRELMHIVIAAQYWFGCWFDWNYVRIPTNVLKMGGSFGNYGKLKFLTYWCALIQSVFFTVCVLNDFIGTNEHVIKKTPLIRKLKEVMLCSLAFPIGMFVGLTFWGIYVFDRELILPKAVDPYFPAWLNHIMHTNIMATSLLELCISFRKYPSRRVGVGILAFVMLGYLIWLHIIQSYTGLWVYPILEVLNFPLRIVFFASLLVFTVGLYILGEFISNSVWAKQLKRLKSS